LKRGRGWRGKVKRKRGWGGRERGGGGAEPLTICVVRGQRSVGTGLGWDLIPITLDRHECLQFFFTCKKDKQLATPITMCSQIRKDKRVPSTITV